MALGSPVNEAQEPPASRPCAGVTVELAHDGPSREKGPTRESVSGTRLPRRELGPRGRQLRRWGQPEGSCSLWTSLCLHHRERPVPAGVHIGLSVCRGLSTGGVVAAAGPGGWERQGQPVSLGRRSAPSQLPPLLWEEPSVAQQAPREEKLICLHASRARRLTTSQTTHCLYISIIPEQVFP